MLAKWLCIRSNIPTIRKSCLNLEKWLAEVMRAEAGSTMYSGAWDGANNDVGEVCFRFENGSDTLPELGCFNKSCKWVCCLPDKWVLLRPLDLIL